MNRRIVYKEQAKCNFCYNWFQVFSEIKFGLNICEACIYKALNTNCFKLPTPQGHLYQVYLARRNILVDPTNQSPLSQKIDEFMHTQIRYLLDKWQEITRILVDCAPQQVEEQIWKQIEFILKNDAKGFSNLNHQTIDQIRQDVIGKNKEQRKTPCTPLKNKNINLEIKRVNKSTKKQMNRMDSKKSLRSFRDLNEKSASKIPQTNIEQQQNINHSEELKSPNAQIKHTGSSRGLNYVENRQNRQFITKMQAIKNNISSHLEVKGETLINEPLNILKERIYQAIQNTNCINKCIELVSFNGLQGIDMKCYLSNLDWEGVEVVKFVKVGLTDEQLQDILEFVKDKNVETLVLTSNSLTEQSCKNILKAEVKGLHNIYLGKNQVFGYKAKAQIKELKSKYNFFL